MSHKLMFGVSLLLAVAHDRIFALSEFSSFMHQINNSFNNAVRPTKEVCLNLECLLSCWNKREEDVFPMSGSYCKTFMCSSVRVRPNWLGDYCSDVETQNVVLPVSLCQSGVWHWEPDKVIFNALTSSQLLNRIDQEISEQLNSSYLCIFS